MVQTALADDFLTAFARIPRRAQNKVHEFATKFRENPRAPGIHYEPIQHARDPRLKSVRIGLDYRAILLAPDDGEVFVLLWVDHHDEAYRWAVNRQVDVHPATGALQLYVTAEDALPAVRAAQAARPEPADTPASGRFSELTDDQLYAGGVPRALIPAVREVYTDTELDALVPYLPNEAAEVLTGVAAGMTLDEALADVLDRMEPPAPAPVEIDIADVKAALERPQSGRRFRVMDEEFDLEAALAYPLDKWRVFLHPNQRRLVERSYNGPMRVLGAAGTGKTVVAMHRAVWLVRKLLPAGDKVLFTTFNVNLAADIRDQLAKIATEDERARIDVVNIDALASRILRDAGEQHRLALESDVRPLWDEAMDTHGDGPWDREFYRAEWRDVVQAQDIRSLDDYLGARRAGRGVKLRRSERAKVWPVLARYRELLDEQRLLEAEDILRMARRYVAERPELRRYAAVVVDEAQDMGTEALGLIRSVAGEERANDLFLVGDAHQRIYGRSVPLSRCGINVHGRRSRHLRINYRTTDTIRRFAMRALEGERFDDLDEGEDEARGYVSLRSGPEPEVHAFDDLASERAFLVSQVRRLVDEGIPPAHVCIVARTGPQLDDGYAPALTAAGIEHERLGHDPPRTAHVRLATMHRVKGLEFPVMILAGMNRGMVPLATPELDSDDPVVAAQALKRERCLLYVASSRARDRLYVTSSASPSPFLA